ncbi:BppU family phage baseplate upper protein [Clostridium perfringens]|nr:BppU family phage baseplate upper protein [Clostridium perfringens]
MAKKDIKFTLDTIDSRYSPVGTVKQLDSVFFYIKITENGVTKDLTGQTIKLFAIKEDKKIVEQTTKINITNQREGLIEIELLNAAIQVHGFTYFELEISDSNGIISTSDFILRVNKRVGSDEAIESTNEVAALKKIEEYVAQAKVELQKFKELQTEMLKTNETINNQEDLRADAELQRVEAENARAVAEEERMSAEQAREENFAHFENKINANTEELETARTSTIGESFNSLDERIDAEINRINKKIEISFLEQEDSESHTIENTTEGMTKDMIIKGRTIQNLFPALETKNYAFQGGDIEGDCLVLPFGANVNDTAIRCIKGKAIIKPNTVYTVVVNILKNDTENNLGMSGYGSALTPSKNSFDNRLGISILKCTSKGVGDAFDYDAFFCIWGNGGDRSKKIKFKAMLLEGDLTQKYIPSYFEGIGSFGEQEGNKISSLSIGKNLLNQAINKKWVFSNGVISANNNGLCFIVKVDPNKQYTISTDISYHNRLIVQQFSDFPQVGDGNSENMQEYTNSHQGTFTTRINTNYLVIYCTNNLEKYPMPYNIQLEEGGKNSNYTPYKENKKEFLLNKYGFAEGLRGLKTKHDELNSISNIATKRIDKYTFTGDENWVLGLQNNGWGEFEDTLVFYIVEFDKMSDCTELICNRFPNINVINTNVEGICNNFFSSKAHPVIRIKKSKLSSQNTEGFKQWLRENQTVIYYELSKPIKTPLSENINSKIFGEKTYVSFENFLSGTSSFKVPVNAAATISRLNRENKALEEENLKLKENMIETSKSLIEVDTNIIATNWDIDYRVCEIEWALEDMGGSSSVNFKLLKKGVGNMALSRYEQAKIMILGGAYEKETLTRQLDAYLKRKYVSQEEYDELIALMEARDMVTNQ